MVYMRKIECAINDRTGCFGLLCEELLLLFLGRASSAAAALVRAANPPPAWKSTRDQI
jgi:hypothetical protein